jgi:hypothetical protein
MPLQLRRINQIPIMRKTDAIRTIDIKGLCLGVRAGTRGWVAEVSHAHEAGEVDDAGAVAEDFGGEPVAFALVDAAAGGAGGDAAGVLAAVLEEVEGVVEVGGGGVGGMVGEDEGEYAAHGDGVLWVVGLRSEVLDQHVLEKIAVLIYAGGCDQI